MPDVKRTLFILGIGLVAAGASGCIERTISITSEPTGALVYVNDQEVGRTPVDLEFLYYGTYDVRVLKEGYEPYVGPAEAKPPVYDLPGIDLLAEMAPLRFHKLVEWHFELEPADVNMDAMIERAREFRDRLGPAEEEAEAGSEERTPTPSERGDEDLPPGDAGG